MHISASSKSNMFHKTRREISHVQGELSASCGAVSGGTLAESPDVLVTVLAGRSYYSPGACMSDP